MKKNEIIKFYSGFFKFTVIHNVEEIEEFSEVENSWYLIVFPPKDHWIYKKLMKCKNSDDVDNIIHFSNSYCTLFDNETLTFGTNYNGINYQFMEDVDDIKDAKPILNDIEALCKFFKVDDNLLIRVC